MFENVIYFLEEYKKEIESVPRARDAEIGREAIREFEKAIEILGNHTE